MKDKEYHVTNFATFVSKTLFFFPLQKLDIWTDQVLYLGDFKMNVIKW